MVFNLSYGSPYYCNNGWNAYPIASNTFAFTAGFNIFASPATLPLAAGASGQVVVSVTQQAGFTAPVSLTATGFPAGATYAFSSPSTTTSSTLTFTVTYTDGTTSTFTQGISDWGFPQNYPGENIASTMPYRLASTGAQSAQTFYIYSYSFALNSTKTVQSITLPNSRNIIVLAITMSGK